MIGGVRAFAVSQYMVSGLTDMPKLKGDLEEADPRLILHMYNAMIVENRHHGLLVAADTDVADIATCYQIVNCISISTPV